jgi:predicted transcriptional regulator
MGPRGREARQARALLKELWVLHEEFGSEQSLADVLSRAYNEVSQIIAPPADFAAKVQLVRTAIFVNGCRTVDDIVDDTNLSRFSVDRAVARLVTEKAVEPRDRFTLNADAEEPGRPATEYHPTDTPRGEIFTHILDRSRDDNLL